MKNKLIPIIVMLIACVVLASAYTADTYTDIDSNLRNGYTADTYTNIDSTFGSDEICSCPRTGTWTVDCTNNCTLPPCDMQTNNVLIDGIGNTINLRDTTNTTRIRIQGGCIARW